MDKYLESKKTEIPMFDPYTGEPNIDYEKLTGKKNPLLEKNLLTHAPLIYEPKKNNRFLLHLPKEFNIPVQCIKSMGKPKFSIVPKKLLGITYGYKKIFWTLNVEIMDLVALQISKRIVDNVDKMFDCFIEELDPTGVIIGTTILKKCSINTVDLGYLNYSNHDTLSIFLQITPKEIAVK